MRSHWKLVHIERVREGETGHCVEFTSSMSVLASLAYLNHRLISFKATEVILQREDSQYIPFLIVTVVIALGWNKSRKVEHHCSLKFE